MSGRSGRHCCTFLARAAATQGDFQHPFGKMHQHVQRERLAETAHLPDSELRPHLEAASKNNVTDDHFYFVMKLVAITAKIRPNSYQCTLAPNLMLSADRTPYATL
jgi:hypothetical protein